MSPESMQAYHKEEAINDYLNSIGKCPIPVIVEFANGDEVKIQKVYRVGGRGACIKILVDELLENPADLDELSDLKTEVEELKEENEKFEEEIKELKESAEKEEKELERIQSALDTAQEKLGFGTAKRKIEDQIDDLFEKAAESIELLTAEIDRLTVDNTALAWNIEQLESWKQNTLKAE